MGLTSSYLVATSRLRELFETLRDAQAPEKFTLTFLKDLGFTSSNERLFIPVLKALGFLDESGTPTERYFAFLDDNRWQLVLAEGIREAYGDLFQLNKNAQSMEKAELIGKLKSLTRGQFSEAVINNMARTFQALAELANFSQDMASRTDAVVADPATPEIEHATSSEQLESQKQKETISQFKPHTATSQMLGALTYRIELVLPPTRDKAIYDALFRSLREHFG